MVRYFNQIKQSFFTLKSTVSSKVREPKIYYSLIVSGLMLLFFFLGAIGAYWEIARRTPATIASITPTPTIKPTPTPEPLPPMPTLSPDLKGASTAGWKTYTHQNPDYSFKYPADWVIVTDKARTGYTDIKIQSPDCEYPTEGMWRMVKGAEFAIGRNSTLEPTVDEFLRKDDFFRNTSEDRSLTTVSGLRAIQYDFCYEGCGTSTNFIKNNEIYYLSVDYIKKEDYYPVYLSILRSFEFPPQY